MGYVSSNSTPKETAEAMSTEMNGSSCTRTTTTATTTAVSEPRVIIFDWDDTICPSSFVDRCQVEHVDELPTHIQRLFAEVEKITERCLSEAAKYGEVIIITNSDEGWVKYSCERYVPRLWPIIERIQVVSARTEYERFYPSQPLCWKAAAFAHEVNEMYEASNSSRREESAENNVSCESLESTEMSSDESVPMGTPSPLSRMVSDVSLNQARPSRREIVSFGDSMEERTAVRIVAEQLSAVPKSVMFVPSPTPVQLIGQLSMLTQYMKYICENDNSLDLEISPEQALRCAESVMKQSGVASPERLVVNVAPKTNIRRTYTE